MQGVAFIDSTNQYLGFRPANAGVAALLFDGAWDISTPSWSFSSGSLVSNASGGIASVGGLYGSGMVTPTLQFQGAYSTFDPNGPQTAFSMDYSQANALAVASGDTAGTWASNELTISVDANGVIAGNADGPKFGVCGVSGTVAPKQAGTSKNLYAVSVALADVTPNSCFLATTSGSYDGYGAITFADTGTSGAPFFVRTFTLLARASNHAWFATELQKQ